MVISSFVSRISRARAIGIAGLLMLALGSVACVSPAYKSFEDVKPGMHKFEVIDLVGNPAKTRRASGVERWTYEFWDHPGGLLVRELRFQDGRVIYAGPPPAPSVSAEQQDKMNETANADDDRRVEEEQEQRDRAVGAFRAPKKGQQPQKLDALDIKLRESLYGVSPDAEYESKKQVPVWEPVE